MLHRSILSLSAILLLIPTAAAQSAGKVGRLLPAAYVTHESATAEAKVAAPVFWNDFLRTNEQGRMRVDLEDGSLLTVGAKSELRVVKHDAASQQSQVDLLYGKVRATVTPVTKPGGSFQVRTPTAVIGVIGSGVLVDATLTTPSTTISSSDLERLPLTQIPVNSSLVTALEHVATVSNIDPAVQGTLYLLPGESARIERGKPPVRVPADAQNEPMLQDSLPSAELCSGFVNLARDVDESKLKYKVIGRGTNLGDVFRVKVWNKSPCTQMVFVPAGAVLKPKGYIEKALLGILGGGAPPMSNFQMMMAEGAQQDAAPAPGAGGGMFFAEPSAETEFSLRGFCLELHKTAPQPNTEYKFDEGKEEKLAQNLKVMESAAKLYHAGEVTGGGHSLDGLTQWSLWANREKMDAKKFKEEYVGLGKKNYDIQKKKLTKDIQRQMEASAANLWPSVEKVLKESGEAPK
jgi:hypothetical protein